jgi:mono/diheme cytochrome c family protein
MIVRYFLLLLVFVSLLVLGIAGLRDYSFLPHKTKRPPIELFPDMVRQDKVKAQAPSDFFADGRGARAPIAGTVPLGYTQPTALAAAGDGAVMGGAYDVVLFAGKEDYANTGKVGTNWGNGLPFEATLATLQRGHDRYQIQCAVCHGATGQGNGIATKYGLVGVANLHQQRIRDMSNGEIYNTIVNGKNTMLGYGASVQVPDRWAIIAYIRALQRSQNATITDVPDDQQAVLLGSNASTTSATQAKP